MAGDINVILGIAPGPGRIPATGKTGIWLFEGRISRSTFWATWLSLAGLGLVVGFIAGNLMRLEQGAAALGVLLLVAMLVVNVWIGLAMQVKRWHDLDRSGWMVLLNFTLVALPVILIILGCVRGTMGDNRFGPDPLGSTSMLGSTPSL